LINFINRNANGKYCRNDIIYEVIAPIVSKELVVVCPIDA
jgi:hypothetical protein